MHTGYNNFWMYQNIRPEPVLSLSKCDSYNHAVITDSYKLLPNGGCPNRLNSHLPQNNVASSHQSNQCRVTNSQCVWPSSVYSLTFRPSYANNFQSSVTYSSQSVPLNCSVQNSQVQQNYDSRHLRNTNLNFPQVFTNTNTNNNDFSNSVQTQSSKSNDTPISRIRVKDVFSLNNNTLDTSLFGNNLLQTYQKEQAESASNNTTINHFTSCSSKIQTEYVDYEKINLLKSNHPYPPYGNTAAEQSKPCDFQKFFQPSNLFQQHNSQLSVDSQFLLNDNKEMEKNLPSKAFNSNSLISLLSDPRKISPAEAQNIQINSCNVLNKSKRIKVQPKRNPLELNNLKNSETVCSDTTNKTNGIHYTSLLKLNEGTAQKTSTMVWDASSQSQYQENLSEIDEKSSSNQDSLTGELKKCKKSRQSIPSNSKYSHKEIKEQESNLIKITVPHTGQSSFALTNDIRRSEENPKFNLPYSLELKNQLLNHTLNRKSPDHNHSKTENNGVFNSSLNNVNQGDSINSKITSSNPNPDCTNPGLIQNDRNIEIGKFDRSFPVTLMSSPKNLEISNQSLHLKEHDVSLKNDENYVFRNSDGLSENSTENGDLKVSFEEKTQSTETISMNDTIPETVIIKQENLYSRVENSDEQFIPRDREFLQNIKIENNVEDHSFCTHGSEPPSSENNLLEVDDTENIEFSKANAENIFSTKKPGPKSKIISDALKNAGNRIQELDVSNDNSGKEKTNVLVKNKMESEESKAKKKKVSQSRRNYKSKINREKLDLLIQFLNKDEKTVEASKEIEVSDYLKENCFSNKREKEVHLNRNRRKLSKTYIVKNKNNSREMISLISHKIARKENFKCPFKTPQFTQNTENLGKNILERSGGGSPVIDRSIDFLKSCDKINDASQENQTQPEDCLKSESKKVSSCKLSCKIQQNPLEKCLSGKESNIQDECNISNTMRTFLNLKTYFCMSCDLISSVDSFWINIASGELRCLNCFKKMIKTEEHVLKSKSEETDDNINLEANVAQKKKYAEKNMHKSGFEDKSESCNGLISVTEFEFDHQNSNVLRKNIKQKLKETLNEPSKDKITIKNSGEMSFMSEHYTVNAVNFSNTSRRQSAEDKISVLEKTVEEQQSKVDESLNKPVKNIKCEDDIVHEPKVLDVLNQEILEFNEKVKRKTAKENNEIADEIQNSRVENPKFSSKQINLEEKCSASKTFPLNQSNKGKNVIKDRSVSPRAKHLKNNNKEKLSDQPVSKSNSSESYVTNKTQILKENTKPELTDKLEKSDRQSTMKEKCISEELYKIKKEKSTDLPNQNRKKNNLKEEFTYPKLKISKEHSVKEVKIMKSLDESVTQNRKIYSKENSPCHKTQKCFSENSLIGIPKKNTQHEQLDNLKVQKGSKDICSNQKPKISEQIKIKLADIAEKSKGKNLFSQNFSDKYKEVKWTDQSRKRKNIEEGFVSHKVRIVEKYAKKEIKSVMHSSARPKEDNADRKNKTLDYEKRNSEDSREKSDKNSSSKENCISFEDSIKKETTQVLDSSEKSKTIGDLSCQKAKTSEHSKHKKNNSSEMPRRKSKDEYISLKPVVTKEPAKSESKKLTKPLDNFRRSSTSKEGSGSVSKHFMIKNLPAENKECKMTEEKGKKHFRGKIPKKSHTDSDININEILRSPLNYGLEEMPNTKAKKEYENGKSNRESYKNGRKNSSEGKEETEAIPIKKEKEAFQQQSDTKIKKEIDSDLNKRKEKKSKMQDLDEQNPKVKIVEEGKKEDVAAEESKPNGHGSEKSILLTELIKKTKKLSWTLLNVTP